MCGRVYMAPANPELRELVREMNRSGIAGRFLEEGRTELTAEGEIFPAAVLPVLATSRAGIRRVFPMKWGFSLNRRTIINARAETAAERPLFRESWQKHRCVIPVSSYFEWEHDENQKATQKYELRKEEPGLMWLAGLYRMEEELPAFVILTREADSSLAWMHDRMPLILPEKEALRWIVPNEKPEEIARHSLTRLVWKKAV